MSFNRYKNNNIRPNEPIAPPKEESILPDDDDVMISDHAPGTSTIPAKRKLQPIIIRKKSIVDAMISTFQPLTSLSNLPRIQISAGKIIPQSSAPVVTTPKAPMHVQNSITAPRPAVKTATICLDSDEEDTPVPIAPTPPAASASTSAPPKTKRVALKSTAKRPVPVSLTAAQHAIIPPELTSQGPQVVNVNQLPNLPPNMNYVVIPQSQFDQFSKNPQSLVMPNQMNKNIIPISSSQGLNVNPPLYLTPVSAVPQFLTQVSSVPQYLNPVGSAPQYLNTVPTAPQTSQSSVQPAPPKLAPKPTFLRRGPAPSVPEKTTQPQKGKSIQAVCKPGDILRITKSGQVEILNRDDDDISIVNEDKNGSTPQNPKETTGSRARMPSKKAMASELKTATPVKVHNIIEKAQPDPPPAKPQTSERIRKISSSSSSSASSRADSPDNFSIFKDIVEIKSVEDILGNKSSEPKSTRNLTNVNKPVTPAPHESRVIGKTSIKKGNSVTQANKTYAEKVPLKTVKANAEPVKGTTKTQVTNKMDVIDLIDLDSTPLPSTSKVWNKLGKDIKVGKPDATTKTAVQKPKDSPIKVVGTSKNIILSGHGKVSSATSTR